MQYTELVIKIKTENVETATDIISLLDIGGIYTEDYSDMMDCPLVKNFALIDEDLLEKSTEYALLHIYFADNANVPENLEFISARFAEASIEMTVVENKVCEEDYANSWKKYYKPLEIGKITVVPEWEDYSSSDGETILRIDPGMAFGTGTHETTSLCLQSLQEHVFEGCSMLDIGCGSGILSIAGLLLGASVVNSIDIDPNAVKVTLENASLNKFSGTIDAVAGNILEQRSNVFELIENKKFDVITANIVADVIIRLCPFIGDYIVGGGIFVVSGIITERSGEVEKALSETGFSVISKAEERGWVCMACKKTN